MDPRAVALVARHYHVTEADVLSRPATLLEAQAQMAFGLADLRAGVRASRLGRFLLWLADRIVRLLPKGRVSD